MSSILKDFNSPMIQQGMQATLSVFKNGGDVNDGSRESDMQEINSIIEDYRDCMKRKAICDATDKNAQSCVYKQKATDCKRKASKLIAKYREKYGRTESISMMMFAKGGNVQKQEDIVDEAKEKLNASFALPIEIAVYVPSTKGADEKISKAEFIERIEETERYLSSKFGGYSKVDIDGGYVSDEKGLIKEDVAKVVAFSQDEKFLSNLLPQLIKRITLWCDDWTQESIGFEIEGDLFYIDKNFQYDKQMFFDGGQTGTLYNVVDEDGDFLLMGADEKGLIEYANTIFYYDMKDSGESEINTLEDAIEGFESMDYIVKESKSNRMPSKFNDGGSIAKGNYEMVLSQAKEIHHHIVELQKVLKKEKEIEAWVVGKIETVSADLSTITHYLEGKSEYGDGGSVGKLNEQQFQQIVDSLESDFGVDRDLAFKSVYNLDNWDINEKYFREGKSPKQIAEMYRYGQIPSNIGWEKLDENEDDGWEKLDESSYFFSDGGEFGGGGMTDLFEDYESQEPKLSKIVQKINDAYDADKVNTAFLNRILKETEAIGYTFEIDMDGSAYGLRPINVPLSDLRGFEEDYDGGEFGGGGSVTSIMTLPKNRVEEIRKSAQMGYNIVQVGMISPKKKGVMLMNEDYQVRGTYPLEYKEWVEKIVEGKYKDGGSVGKNLKRVVRKGTKYGKLAVKKAKPKAKKIVRKLKLGFNALANKVAKSYEGKAVAPKYQKEYGKRYSKEEAKEVGKKVAAQVKRIKGV